LAAVSPGSWVYLDGFPECAGSFGLPVRDRSTRETLLLTAAHAAGSLAKGFGRTDRTMFGSGSGVGGSLDEHLGSIVRSVPPVPANDLAVDAAVIRPRRGITFTRVVDREATSGKVWDLLTTPSAEPISVHKRGARTGFQSGWLYPEPADHLLVDQTQGECWYRDGFYIERSSEEPFALAGDSGAVVIDDNDLVLGMVVGVENDGRQPEDRAFCTPIMPILDALNVDLIGP
jgi:hypothetical protein